MMLLLSFAGVFMIEALAIAWVAYKIQDGEWLV